MLSNDKCIDAARSNACLGRQSATQTRGVEECAAADDLCGWEARVLQGEVGEDIDWLSDEEKCSS